MLQTGLSKASRRKPNALLTRADYLVVVMHDRAIIAQKAGC